MVLDYVSLFLIAFAILTIIVGVVVVHELPGKIAEKRQHPQTEAIKVMSYLGLLVFPLWMAALIWAHFRPWKVAGFDDEQAAGAVQAPDAKPDPA